MFSQLKPKQNNPKRSGPRQGFKIKISPIEILKCTLYIPKLLVMFTFSLKLNCLSTLMCLPISNKILNHYYQSTHIYKNSQYLESYNAQCPFASLPAAETKAV